MFYIYAYKYQQCVTVFFNVGGIFKAVDSFADLVDLPQEYTPPIFLYSNYITQKGEEMLLQISPAGKISLYNLNTELNDFYLRQCITYITTK